MKRIAVCGYPDNPGRTALTRAIRELLPDVQVAADDCLQRPPVCAVSAECIGVESLAPSATRIEIRWGERVSSQTLAALADALGVSASVARRVCWLVGARPEPITGIVLAGGASSRMGSDKAFLRIGAESAIERALRQLRPLVDHVVVSAAERNSALFGDLHVAVDREPGQGPLMGVACGLAASSTAINFLVACDIPEIDPLLVCRLLSHIDDHDIVVPSLKHGTQEPLFGVYRTCVAQAADLMLHEHRRQATGLSAHCRVLVLPVEHSEWYANLNTREDFAQYVSRNPHDSHREETRNER